MALHTTLPIYGAIYELLGVAGEIIFNMRRDAKKLFGEKIIEACIDLDLHLRQANIDRDKEPRLLLLLERLEVIELLARLCRDRKFMSAAQYGRIIERTQIIGRQANKLRGYNRDQSGEQQRQLFDGHGHHDSA